MCFELIVIYCSVQGTIGGVNWTEGGANWTEGGENWSEGGANWSEGGGLVCGGVTKHGRRTH